MALPYWAQCEKDLTAFSPCVNGENCLQGYGRAWVKASSDVHELVHRISQARVELTSMQPMCSSAYLSLQLFFDIWGI